MIPIKILNTEKALTDHWKGISTIFNKNNKDQINEWIRQIDGLSEILGNDPIKELICGDFNKLKQIKEKVNRNQTLNFFKSKYESFTRRSEKNKKTTYSPITLVENIGITVCPYCNRSFIYSARNKRTCQLDHFFSKDKYPYLALSFFNLVPSCYACNHVKSNTDEGLLSPYESFRTDDLLKFKWSLGDSSFRYSKGKIDLKPSFTSQGRFSLQKNFDVFGLEDLYKKHKDVVQEILMKEEIYSNDYIKSLVAQFPDLIASEEEAMRLVTGNYVLEDDLGKRPLAKLTRDIAKSVGWVIK